MTPLPADPFLSLVGRRFVMAAYPDEETLELHFEGGITLTLPNENWVLRQPRKAAR